ncbi:hypothetical protein SAMN05920897_11864 [Alkalispirochaeta americana]|uniref:Uncharacterized protein n=1 Tax=Alkalispirochaeta americana TaxID=159291 RepID=A0A1N6WSC5_9SPIO|nr:hypothetical protein SAMN05920897_11864 [Alkalispirochaeta americana]
MKFEGRSKDLPHALSPGRDVERAEPGLKGAGPRPGSGQSRFYGSAADRLGLSRFS